MKTSDVPMPGMNAAIIATVPQSTGKDSLQDGDDDAAGHDRVDRLLELVEDLLLMRILERAEEDELPAERAAVAEQIEECEQDDEYIQADLGGAREDLVHVRQEPVEEALDVFSHVE